MTLKHSQPDDTLKPLAVRIPEACRMIGIGKTKLYALMASGDLDKIKIGKATLISVASLKALLRADLAHPPTSAIQMNPR